jgi:hypothetical protein
MRAFARRNEIRCARTFGQALLAVLLAAAASGAQGDVVTDWNAATYAVMRAVQVDGAPGARALAIVHVSMADAVNTVQNRYTRYAYRGPLQPSASAEVAAASAARTALVALWPAQKARIEETYAAARRAIPDGPAADAGEAIGKEAAEAVLADRANDNSSVPDTYRPLTSPGVWVPTTPPLTAQYARVKPWGFERPDQFRPGPPPALASVEYARDYNETKMLGAVGSTARTKEQSDAVKFWSQPNIMEAWHQVSRQLASSQKMGLAECARLFALMTMANANTFIVDWDAKFHYNYWRPVTAIRNGDNDGNDATERDAGWTPLNTTPMHPEYPSQAAILAGAGTAALAAALGGAPNAPVSIADSADPKLTRSLAGVAALAEEQRLVRIWGGIHFRTSLEVSDRMGQAIVKHLAETTYRPVD